MFGGCDDIWLLKLVTSEWHEQVTGPGLEIEPKICSVNDAQTPSPPT